MEVSRTPTSPADIPELAERSQRAVFVVTLIYFVVELAGGLYYNSLALVTDASFMAVNVMGQLIAVAATRMSRKQPDARHTFGYERAKVLSGLLNGVLVGFVVFYVFMDAYAKIRHPQPIDAGKVLVIAVIGLAVNGFGLWRLSTQLGDVNVKGAYLLVLNDALGSVGVIISAIIIHYTELYVVDALTGVVISLLVAYPTYFLVRDTVHVLMEGNPSGVSAEEIERFITDTLHHARSVKDLRIWAITPDRVILVVRVRTDGKMYHRNKMLGLKAMLQQRFGLADVYIESYEDELEEPQP